MRRFGRINWGCIAALAMVGLVCVAILYPAIRGARRAAFRATRINCLRQVGLALHNFNDIYRRLPPPVRVDKAGNPMCSWRFQIVPFVEAIMRGVDYDARWDDPVNDWLASQPYPIFCWQPERESPARLHTNVVAITGPGTAFDPDCVRRLDEMDADTVLAIEIADSGKHWMEPGDLHVDKVPESIMKGLDGEGVHVLFADGSVQFVSADVPLADLKKFFTIEGAKQYDREELLVPRAAGR